ncbi:MAG: flagellar hook assembly protein FlgD [Deltaproteobacteria bacterium]|nr:flagellar hook assembly protein FlgD [Deltaproteobacteria bacterium]
MSIAMLEQTSIQTSGNKGLSQTKLKETLGRDDFLILLVAQLKHQDPLNPLDGTDFTAQLAQFSSLEQLFTANDRLTDISESMDLQKTGDVLDYIGKTVKTTDNTILVENGETAPGAYNLEDKADVTVFILNDDGLEVRRIYEGWQNAGEHDLVWDGRDNDGRMVDDGAYTFELEARDKEGFVVPYNTYLTGEVTGVTYERGMPYLMVGNNLVSPSSVVEVGRGVGSKE